MRIAALLEEKGRTVATIPSTATVHDVTVALARFGIGALVVSDDGARIDGIVSERDVVRHLVNDERSLLTAPVVTIMSRTVRTCSPDDDVEALMALMTLSRIRHVPVVEDGVLCGIVSIGDVVKSRIADLEKDRRELVDYIGAR